MVSRDDFAAETHIMIRAWLVLLTLAFAPGALAQPLPPPRNPAGSELAPPDDLILRRVDRPQAPPQGPALAAPINVPPLPPQNGQQQQQPPVLPPQAAQNAKKNADPLHDLIMARHKAEKERLQARMDRANLAQAARAAEDQKLYQDWHERYLADTPVRVEYYRAQAAAYQSQPAIPYYGGPYFYAAGPAVILPPIYAPVIYAPVYRPYGTFLSWGW
jgi:hypothetical protein